MRDREVLLPWATARPERFTVRRSQVGRGAQDYTEEVHEFPIVGMGLHWEADAVARDIRGTHEVRTAVVDFIMIEADRRKAREREDAARGHSAYDGYF